MDRRTLTAEELAALWPAELRHAAVAEASGPRAETHAPAPGEAAESAAVAYARAAWDEAPVPLAYAPPGNGTLNALPPDETAGPVAADRPSRRPSRGGAGIAGGLVWALIGFVLGAVFWHFVGFWGFVREVVLKGHPDDFRPVLQTGAHCTELALDRAGKRTIAQPCPGDAPTLRDQRQGQRADFARATERAKTQTQRLEWSPSVLIAEDERRAAEPPPESPAH